MKIFKKKKGKVGKSFRRKGMIYDKSILTKEDFRKVLCFNWNSFTYESIQQYMVQVLHSRKESKKKNLPIVIIGDAKFPPLLTDVDRYYLNYNPDNFIGEYAMRLFRENAFLIFFLHAPEDFVKIEEIAHRTIYLGSLCKILLVCSSDAALPQELIRDKSITDYNIMFEKNGENCLPNNNTLKTFEYLIPKNL
jgi:hypothetical protein